MNMSPLTRRLAAAGLPQDQLLRIPRLVPTAFREGAILPLVPAATRCVSSGWVIAQHRVGDLNQILRLHLPGDLMLDISNELPSVELVALTRCSTVDLPHEITQSRGFVDVMAEQARAETKRVFEHTMRLGRMDAYQRLAHFILELDERWRLAHPETGDRIPFEMKQPEIGDYLALSAVHVNRTLMALRRDGLIELRPGLKITDRSGLVQAAKAVTPLPQPTNDVLPRRWIA